VTAPASSPVLSDPVDLPTQDLDRLAVSIYVPGQVAPRQPRTRRIQLDTRLIRRGSCGCSPHST